MTTPTIDPALLENFLWQHYWEGFGPHQYERLAVPSGDINGYTTGVTPSVSVYSYLNELVPDTTTYVTLAANGTDAWAGTVRTTDITTQTIYVMTGKLKVLIAATTATPGIYLPYATVTTSLVSGTNVDGHVALPGTGGVQPIIFSNPFFPTTDWYTTLEFTWWGNPFGTGLLSIPAYSNVLTDGLGNTVGIYISVANTHATATLKLSSVQLQLAGAPSTLLGPSLTPVLANDKSHGDETLYALTAAPAIEASHGTETIYPISNLAQPTEAATGKDTPSKQIRYRNAIYTSGTTPRRRGESQRPRGV